MTNEYFNLYYSQNITHQAKANLTCYETAKRKLNDLHITTITNVSACLFQKSNTKELDNVIHKLNNLTNVSNQSKLPTYLILSYQTFTLTHEVMGLEIIRFINVSIMILLFHPYRLQ